MTYTVVWFGAASIGIAQTAAGLTDPAAAEREAVWMDTILRRYPNSMGESRWGGHRIWYGDVIGIWYVVDDVAMTVRVLAAGPARRR
jgi:hypothetical protein